jgi:DinB superfamily
MPLYEGMMIGGMGTDLDRAYEGLKQISEENASQRYGDGVWTRKELLGHLIDSATNNRYQIVKTLVDGSYVGPSYNQEGWVKAHRYAGFRWTELVEAWRVENTLLRSVLSGITEPQWKWTCGVGFSENATLRDKVDDYFGHLEHHLGQM